MTNSSIGLVHDYLLVMRGAERTFAEIASCWPDAPIYTLLYDEAGTDRCFEGREIHASFLQRLRVRQRGFRRFLPFFPRAVEHLPVGSCDLVVSSSSAFAHGVRAAAGAVHVCYCHSPFRYAWHERERALAEARRPMRPQLRRTLDQIRSWDLAASRAVTHYIANSDLTRIRMERYWGREAGAVIHPPVEVDRFAVGEPEDFLLIVTELVAHKRVDLALDAARRAGCRVKVVGVGPERQRLARRYDGRGAEFLGRVSDGGLEDLYARARALVVPNVEEFGIAAVEAQAAGRPVLAADGGGARETVIDGSTGILVPSGSVDALAEAMSQTDFDRFSPERIRANAARFSTEVFRARFLAEMTRLAGNSGMRA